MKTSEMLGHYECGDINAEWEIANYPKHIFKCKTCGLTIQDPEYVNLMTRHQMTMYYLNRTLKHLTESLPE